MSGLEVIGGISAVIAIVNASVEIWDNAQTDIKLPETFKIVARRLPLLLSILQICHDELDHIKDTLRSDVIESFRSVVQNSKAQAQLLLDIFEKTVPGEDAKRVQRLQAAVKSVGKGRTVERILQSISEDTRILASYHSIKAARPELTADLERLIKELQNAEPSVEEEPPSSSAFQNHNYGGGQQNISTGHSRHSGHGDQHVYGGVGAINQYSGRHTQG